MLRTMMYQVNNRRTYATAMAHVCLSFFTAPLLTLSTSLQCSMPMARITLENLNPEKVKTGLGQSVASAGEEKRTMRAQKFMQLNLKDKGETVR